MSKETNYEIKKILNNNVIIATPLKNDQEMVIIGNGIGFESRNKDRVKLSDKEINKTYITYQNELQEEFTQLLNELDGQVMGLGEEIIARAEEKLGPLNDHIHIALTDHISFAIERMEEGMEINNPFLEETRVLYDEEYKIAQEAVNMVHKRLEVKLPVSEAGFIAMHLHAARQNKEVSDTVKNTTIIKRLVELVEKELNIRLEPGNLSYKRLINHLRFSLNRLKKEKKINNPFLDNIREEFTSAYKVAQKIAKKIEERIDVKVGEDEIGFIALHIKRLEEYKKN